MNGILTKPAVKSSTIWSAVATIFASLGVLLGAYAINGEAPPIPLLLVEVPILIAQVRIITERLKRNRKPIQGVV